MNRHLMIKTSCFSVIAPALPYYRPSMDICVLELRNSPAITRIPRLESEHFNHNLFDPDLIRGTLGKGREHMYKTYGSRGGNARNNY